jgi:tetratricopeptide (TPR) repeat protein
LLESQGATDKVPPGKRREIVHRLGGNPRALKTLASSLRSESLDDLLSSAPDLSTIGDVAIHAELVEEFERELLERALPKLEADLLKFMRWLSVYRRPFHKEAMAQFSGGLIPPDELRKQLMDRFLLENTLGGDTPHPLAREISVTRLRAESSEWAQAHSLAASYYFRPFKAKQLGGASNLAASYTELRHHLYEAGRIDELHEASERLTRYAVGQIGLTTPVPRSREALDERITLLSTLPDDRRPRVLEYHLAVCLLKRGAAGDKECALRHVRKGAGSHPDSSPWILRLNLEYELHGIDSVLPVVNEALRGVGPNGDAGPIYLLGADLMAKSNRLDDAIKLLEKSIAVPGMTSLSSLYQACAELMAKSNRLDDAIQLLEKGIGVVPAGANLFSLYQACAELMVKNNRLDDAIQLLEKGIGVVPAGANLYSLYQACAELMAKSNRLDDAIKLLEKGIAVPGMTSLS